MGDLIKFPKVNDVNSIDAFFEYVNDLHKKEDIDSMIVHYKDKEGHWHWMRSGVQEQVEYLGALEVMRKCFLDNMF